MLQNGGLQPQTETHRNAIEVKVAENQAKNIGRQQARRQEKHEQEDQAKWRCTYCDFKREGRWGRQYYVLSHMKHKSTKAGISSHMRHRHPNHVTAAPAPVKIMLQPTTSSITQQSSTPTQPSQPSTAKPAAERAPTSPDSAATTITSDAVNCWREATSEPMDANKSCTYVCLPVTLIDLLNF